MRDLRWPDEWQADAIAAVEPYVDTEHRLDIWLGDPATSLSGTRMAGYLYADDDGGEVMIIHDRSGRADVFPWRLLAGPVLLIKLLRPRRAGVELYRHPEWSR